MSKRYAVIVQATGNVESVVMWDGISAWEPPTGTTAIQSDTANIGDTWNGTDFVPAPQSPPKLPYVPPTPRQWLERLAPATQSAITAAAAKDTTGALLLWLLKAAGNPSIDVTSPETQQGVQALVAAGIITAHDQQTLLAP
jgi:hypothetical protein